MREREKKEKPREREKDEKKERNRKVKKKERERQKKNEIYYRPSIFLLTLSELFVINRETSMETSVLTGLGMNIRMDSATPTVNTTSG